MHLELLPSRLRWPRSAVEARMTCTIPSGCWLVKFCQTVLNVCQLASSRRKPEIDFHCLALESVYWEILRSRCVYVFVFFFEFIRWSVASSMDHCCSIQFSWIEVLVRQITGNRVNWTGFYVLCGINGFDAQLVEQIYPLGFKRPGKSLISYKKGRSALFAVPTSPIANHLVISESKNHYFTYNYVSLYVMRQSFQSTCSHQKFCLLSPGSHSSLSPRRPCGSVCITAEWRLAVHLEEVQTLKIYINHVINLPQTLLSAPQSVESEFWKFV